MKNMKILGSEHDDNISLLVTLEWCSEVGVYKVDCTSYHTYKPEEDNPKITKIVSGVMEDTLSAAIAAFDAINAEAGLIIYLSHTESAKEIHDELDDSYGDDDE